MIILLCFCNGCSQNEDKIDADDNGVGKKVKIYPIQNKDAGNTLKDTDGTLALKWTDTELSVSVQNSEDAVPSIGISIQGQWYPWGNISSSPQECQLITCDQSSSSQCSDLASPSSVQIVKNYFGNYGCYLNNGLGIYLLIAKRDENNVYADPNQNALVANSPSSALGFYTAHLGAFPQSRDGSINVDKAWACDEINGKIECSSVPIQTLNGGRVFLKVVDNYYADNASNASDNSITINMKKGVYYPNFVSAALFAFKNTLDYVTDLLKKSLMNSLKDIVFVIILLYFVLTAFGFMTGLVQLTQTEAVVRLLKIGIVVLLTSPGNIIGSGFISLYDNLSTLAADIIANAIPDLPSSGQTPNKIDGLAYLGVYDGILNQVLSIQVHLKIWSLMRCLSRIWCIPMLYILLIIIITVVFKSLLIYITAYVQMSILIIMLPILAVTMLFKVTASFFQDWLKYMANSAMMIVIATLGLGLVLGMMNKDLQSLLNYSISNTNWFLWFYWWEPDSAVTTQLNASSYFLALFTALICNIFVEHVPKFADALTDAQLAPTSQGFKNLLHGMHGTFHNAFNKVSNQIQSINSKYLMGRLLDQRYKKDGQYSDEKEGKGLLDKWKSTRDKADKFWYKTIGAPLDIVKGISEGDDLSGIAQGVKQKWNSFDISQASKNAQTANDYEKMIEEKMTHWKSEQEKVDALKDSVRVDLGGGQQQEISIKDDGIANVNVNNVDIPKAFIKDAIENHNGVLHHNGVQYDFSNLHDKELSNKVQEKLNELTNIKKELDKVKRR